LILRATIRKKKHGINHYSTYVKVKRKEDGVTEKGLTAVE